MNVTLIDNRLHREIGPFSATAVVIANMIGLGIFTTLGFSMAERSNPDRRICPTPRVPNTI